MSSSVRNSTLSLRGVQTTAVALMIESRRGGGSVDVFLNGTLLRRISTNAARLQVQRLVTVASWTRIHTGTITIRVSSTGRPVVIDGLALSRI
jgi:hypothetical protein